MDFQEKLLHWYQSNGRKLPWRETSEPYAIWISEVMLQQTQVQTVIPYYHRFMEAFPTVYALASAEEDEVLKFWEGLGYYSRARKLMECAKVLVSKYHGIFPRSHEEVLALPGIGPYTAGAILSIAFNQKVPAVDGNVMRVISRVYNLTWDISATSTRKLFEAFVANLLPENRCHFNQGLMELGATICTPLNPSCSTCPVATNCKALELEVIKRLPVKTKKIKKVVKQVAVAYVTCNDKVLITKRNESGLLSGLWGFPVLESDEVATPSALEWELSHHWNIKGTYVNTGKHYKHVFTHIIWEVQVLHFKTEYEVALDYPKIEWVSLHDLQKYPFPTAFQKVIQY